LKRHCDYTVRIMVDPVMVRFNHLPLLRDLRPKSTHWLWLYSIIYYLFTYFVLYTFTRIISYFLLLKHFEIFIFTVYFSLFCFPDFDIDLFKKLGDFTSAWFKKKNTFYFYYYYDNEFITIYLNEKIWSWKIYFYHNM